MHGRTAPDLVLNQSKISFEPCPHRTRTALSRSTTEHQLKPGHCSCSCMGAKTPGTDDKKGRDPVLGQVLREGQADAAAARDNARRLEAQLAAAREELHAAKAAASSAAAAAAAHGAAGGAAAAGAARGSSASAGALLAEAQIQLYAAQEEGDALRDVAAAAQRRADAAAAAAEERARAAEAAAALREAAAEAKEEALEVRVSHLRAFSVERLLACQHALHSQRCSDKGAATKLRWPRLRRQSRVDSGAHHSRSTGGCAGRRLGRAWRSVALCC